MSLALAPALAVGLRAAARSAGTPVYVTDVAALDRACAAVRDAFPDPWVRQYSVKANDTPAVIAAVAARGFGANVVSRGEWAAVRRAGIPNADTTLEGIGKTQADLRAAVAAARDGVPLRWVALESEDEAAALARIARQAGVRVDVLYRLNPDVVPETLAVLAVGAGASKFGMTETEIGAAIDAGGGPDGPLRPRGIHLHVGSQLGAVDAWREAVRKALALTALWRGSIETFDTVDVGGGFPVASSGLPEAAVPSPARFAREVPSLLDAIPVDRRPSRLAVEPGRALVARAGWLVARVLHVRERGGPQVVIDAGMTELIRPALYGAHHAIVALAGGPGAAVVPTRVEGPICESTDSLGVHDLPPLRRGDLVAIADAGAYAASQRSAYNGRRRPGHRFIDPSGTLRP